jgi:hypothetical protein
MPTFRTEDDVADAEIVDAELHSDSRLRYIQHRMQEDEGLRLSIDSISYLLRCNSDYERLHGLR